MGQRVACVVDVLERVASQVKVLLRSNYVDVAPISNSFADKGYVLQTEQSYIPFYD